MSKTKVVVLVGGSSMERTVSFHSADNILNNIDKNKYDIKVVEVPKDKNNNWVTKIIEINPAVVFSALHGGRGENGTVQGLLKCLNIPFVGSSVFSSALCMDKNISKTVMKSNHIPVIDGVFIPKNDKIIQYQEKINELGYPVIVKPNRGGSSIGINIAENYEQVIKAINKVNKFNDDIIIEKFIVGKEINCSVLQTKNGLKVLSVLDITTNNKFYDYKAKYIDKMTKIDLSNLPEYMKTMIEEIAKKVFNLLKCKGYACIDMIIREEQIYVIEVNTLPGLTVHSLIPKAVSRLGISFSQFIDELIEFELR